MLIAFIAGILLQEGAPEQPDPDPKRKTVVVEERHESFKTHTIEPDLMKQVVPDTANMLKRVPGADVQDNGPVSGQAQYRGMFGPRMNLRIDGMFIVPAGPNWMDPPLHYVPRPLLETLEVHRGISPVRLGDESIGGTIRATTRSSEFSRETVYRADLETGFRSVDDSTFFGGRFALQSDRHRLHVVGSAETGDDREFGAGTISASAHDRVTAGLGYGFRSNGSEFSLDYRRLDTGETGNPSLPMDMMLTESDLVRLGFEGERIRIRIYGTRGDHEMDNFTLRPTPDFGPPGPDPRHVIAEADTVGFDLRTTFEVGSGTLTLGLDGHRAEHNMLLLNPMVAAFFVRPYHDVERDRTGAFAEWAGSLSGGWSLELGARGTRVEMNAGAAAIFPGAPPMALGLATTFNSIDHRIEDTNVDWVGKLIHHASQNLDIEFEVGRKTRSPSYVERYTWIPLETTAGFGDGNNYLGDLTLEPEVGHEVGIGFHVRHKAFEFTPRVFYREVKDYIQGMPAGPGPVVMVSTMNGDATPLVFTNVDAKFYGVDAALFVRLSEAWSFEAGLAYIRGRRDDITDDLYRIPPLNGSLGLTYETETWSVTAVGEFVDRQDRISDTIVTAEPSTDGRETPGYGLLNLYGRIKSGEDVTITIGVENALDKDYREHLSGFNRVIGSDIPLGERIHGPGRSAFISVILTY